MKPVLVLQHLTADGPAYLAAWLRREGVAFEVCDAEAGEAYPERIDGWGALAILGGEMSANDALPSLRRAEALVRDAMRSGVPVIGHCLGGQLMARAMGAKVAASPAPEIGWQALALTDAAEARDWFGPVDETTVYHWHSESFDLPPEATLLATSPACPHQAFAVGPHLAMQFHVELDAEKLGRWAASVEPSYLRLQREHPATVHAGARMLEEARRALPAQQALADRIYRRWLAAAG